MTRQGRADHPGRPKPHDWHSNRRSGAWHAWCAECGGEIVLVVHPNPTKEFYWRHVA